MPEPHPHTPEHIMELREVVDEVRVEIQPEISEWSSRSMVPDTWLETRISGPTGTTLNPIFVGLTLFFFAGH